MLLGQSDECRVQRYDMLLVLVGCMSVSVLSVRSLLAASVRPFVPPVYAPPYVIRRLTSISSIKNNISSHEQ